MNKINKNAKLKLFKYKKYRFFFKIKNELTNLILKNVFFKKIIDLHFYDKNVPIMKISIV